MADGAQRIARNRSTIRDRHLNRGLCVGAGFRALEASSDQGIMYLRDAAWARRFADASRRAIATEVGTVMETILGARLCWDTAITTDHNHVSLENHQGRELGPSEGGDASCTWASGGAARVMGSSSFHVEGRGHEAALCSSAHGAGRALSRTAARAKVTEREFRRQMEGV